MQFGERRKPKKNKKSEIERKSISGEIGGVEVRRRSAL